MPNYGSMGPVALLAAGTVTPLICTLAPAEPFALAAGVILAGFLIRLTFDPRGPAPKSFDKGIEASSYRNVILTSSSNRGTRILLGSVYLYAAFTFVMRTVPGEAQVATKALALDPTALATAAAAWLGAFVDLYIAGIWLSSGADGQ